MEHYSEAAFQRDNDLFPFGMYSFNSAYGPYLSVKLFLQQDEKQNGFNILLDFVMPES